MGYKRATSCCRSGQVRRLVDPDYLESPTATKSKVVVDHDHPKRCPLVPVFWPGIVTVGVLAVIVRGEYDRGGTIAAVGNLLAEAFLQVPEKRFVHDLGVVRI